MRFLFVIIRKERVIIISIDLNRARYCDLSESTTECLVSNAHRCGVKKVFDFIAFRRRNAWIKIKISKYSQKVYKNKVKSAKSP